MSTYLAVIAASWGVAMALAPLLQIRTVVDQGTARGVSIGYQQVLLFGFLLWLAYGIAIGNAALIVPNTIAAIVSATTILVVRRYRRRDSSVGET